MVTGIYAETLDHLRCIDDEVSGAELGRLMDCEPTAMNNRLAALERMGLATSRRFGRKRLFAAIDKRK